MNRRASILAFFLLVAMGAPNLYAQAANLKVNCNKHESISKVVGLLAKTNPLGPTTPEMVSSDATASLVSGSTTRTDVPFPLE